MRLMQRIVALAALLLATACSELAGGEAEQQRPPPPYLGDPYLGSVDVRASLPDDHLRDALNATGTGSAQFVDEGEGRARLILVGNIEREGDAGFVLEGSYDENGWRSRDQAITLALDADGRIEGTGLVHPHRLHIRGTAAETSLMLKVEIELLEPSESGFPEGAIFQFDYALHRDAADADAPVTAAQPQPDGDGNCKAVKWRMRSVANFSGGPAHRVRVPVCIK
ncbi:hypothetical protein [Luteimonas suaedae]|uniref:hypothetical protein n=1 Tax=Luteimonas suaedae TaxID=2605430 RepID=UPI0011EC3453|nr:hypothetical protein [Luteimonas suaedae]